MKPKETHTSKRQLAIESMDSRYQWRTVEWGGFNVSFQKALDDVDFAPLFKGEPDNMCQCHHWGFVLKGKMAVRYKDHEEIINAKEAYYIAPGHIPFVTKGTELLEFTRKTEMETNAPVAKKNLRPTQAEEKTQSKKKAHARTRRH